MGARVVGVTIAGAGVLAGRIGVLGVVAVVVVVVLVLLVVVVKVELKVLLLFKRWCWG